MEGRRRERSPWWARLTGWLRTGAGWRLAGHLAWLAVVALGVWAARAGLDSLPLVSAPEPVAAEATLEPTATPLPQVRLEDLPPFAGGPALVSLGIVPRHVDPHTIIPSRPRLKVIQYEVQPGDSLFGIADKFGLKPETILWGNFETLKDDPHLLRPGQVLNILPVDGTYYQWHEGDKLTAVAAFFGVTPRDIIDWPGNELPPDIDPENPDIEPGTWLVIPGGRREFVTWRAPRITRSNPAVARVGGPGACGAVYDGPIGTGTFVWPTPSTWISGYTFSSFHPGIDIGGAIGNAIFAADSGVVVYAGWNNYGYGNLIVIDHGNGWQTLYAHLSAVNVGCGQAVFQGNVIGAMGCTGNCTGPHLHFEMMHDTYGRVNPLDFLP